MKNFYPFLLPLIISSLSVFGQTRFVIDSVPANTPEEGPVYMAGDFNGWSPGDAAYRLSKNEQDRWQIFLSSEDVGTQIQYKFTRGDWGTVEKGIDGEEIANRNFTFGTDTVVHHVIFNWADGGGSGSTAAENVFILDEAFEMPQLNRNRRVWIYLPPDYDESDKEYPVIYMHDGQNLFDEITSFAGEWEVDETLNQLAGEGYQVPIVIGIDNGGIYRGDELMPWYNSAYDMGGQGSEYMAFIVETLKPYVDANYRTRPEREYTGIMGSSLGGLISTYGALQYQEVFSKSGPFSPAYWINKDSLMAYVDQEGFQQNIRFYQNIGQNENAQYAGDIYAMEESLKQVGFSEVSSKVISGGGHNEATWRSDFRTAYLWLFDSFASDIHTLTDNKRMILAPNPATTHLVISNIDPGQGFEATIYDTSGRLVMQEKTFTNTIRISSLSAGTYVLVLKSGDKTYRQEFIRQ